MNVFPSNIDDIRNSAVVFQSSDARSAFNFLLLSEMNRHNNVKTKVSRVRCAIIHTLRTNDDTCTFALLRIHSSPAQTLSQHAQTHRRTRTEISNLLLVGFRCLERKCTGIKNRLFLSAMPDKFQSFSFASFAPCIEKIFLVSRSPSPRCYRAHEIISQNYILHTNTNTNNDSLV